MSSDSKQLKVLFILPTFFPANRGSPARVSELCQALHERGYECHVLSYGRGDGREIPAVLHNIPELPVYTRPGPGYGRLILDLLLVWKAFRLLFSNRYSVIHAHLHEGALVALLARCFRSVPIVFTVHSVIADELADQGFAGRRSLTGRIATWLDAWLPRAVDGCICLSLHMEKRYAELAPSTPVMAVINPTDLEYFSPRSSELRKTLGLDDRLVLGFQGNTAPMQLLDKLIEQATAIRELCPTATFLIGYTSDPSHLQKLVAEKGLTDCFHFVEAPYAIAPDLINALDVAVLPRLEKTPSMKLSNILACGVPVILFAGTAEGITTEPMESGMIPFETHSDLPAILTGNLDLPELGKRARQFAESELSRDRFAERVLEMYQKAGVSF